MCYKKKEFVTLNCFLDLQINTQQNLGIRSSIWINLAHEVGESSS